MILLLIVLPTLELVLLIKLGSYIGALATVAIVFISAIIGAGLLRREGFSTLLKARERLEAGQMPAREVAEGALLVVAGAFMLTPGFITDAVGFACLIPPVRRHIANTMLKHMTVQVGSVSGFSASGPMPGAGPVRPNVDEGTIIEGEFQRRE